MNLAGFCWGIRKLSEFEARTVPGLPPVIWALCCFQMKAKQSRRYSISVHRLLRLSFYVDLPVLLISFQRLWHLFERLEQR